MMRNKLKTAIAALCSAMTLMACAATIQANTLTVQAEANYAPLEVNYVTTMDEANTPYSYSQEYKTENDNTQYGYFSFTLATDSYVCLAASATSNRNIADINVQVGSDPSVANMVLGLPSGMIVWKEESKNGYAVLKAGTYFGKVTIREADSPYEGCVGTVSCMIKAVPLNFVANAAVTPSADYKSATVTINSADIGAFQQIRYMKGEYGQATAGNNDLWSIVSNDNVVDTQGNTSFTVTQNGKYSVRLKLQGDATYCVVVNVNCIDKSAPVIKGVKNNKTYNKAVTIKVKDKNSGLKKVTLNGKKIKATKKIKKNGTYKIVAVDKAGHVKTIKFKIKK